MSINLLDWRQQRRHQQQKLIILGLMALLILVAVTTVAFRLVIHHYSQHLSKEIQQAQSQIKKLNYTPAIKQHYQRLNHLQKIIQLSQLIKKQRQQLFKLFLLLEKLMPNNLRITQLSVQQSRISLHGNAASNHVVTQFVDQLSKQAYFKSVTLKKINKIKQVNQFQLIAEV